MIGYIILISMVLIIGLIAVILFIKYKAVKKENKFDDHLIHAMNDAIIEDGKITREANEKRDKNDSGSSASAITAELNSL